MLNLIFRVDDLRRFSLQNSTLSIVPRPHRDIASSTPYCQRRAATLDWTGRATFGTCRCDIEHSFRERDRAVTRDRVELITSRRRSDLDRIAAFAVDRQRGCAIDRHGHISAPDVEPSFGSQSFYVERSSDRVYAND